MTRTSPVLLIAASVTVFIAYRLHLAWAVRLKAQKHGCQPARRYKHKDPIFGLDILLKTGDNLAKNTFLEMHQQHYNTYGHTFEALNLGSRKIYSVHPDNIRAVFSKNAADWGIQPIRMNSMHEFCGVGFVTAEGEEWKRSHNLLKPGFHKSNISDFTPLEEHLQMMLSQIPKDGSRLDLQPWIFKMVSHLACPMILTTDGITKYLDLNTLFLFGEPIGMLSGHLPPHAEGFLDAFQEGFNGCGMQIALGPLKFLMPKGNWLKACKKTHEFANVYVKRALEYREKLTLAGNGAPKKQRTLLYNMAQQTGDKTDLQNQIVQAMMVASETTGTLISNIIYNLAAHPLEFAKLRTEILAVSDQPLDFDRLAKIKYLQYVIAESTSIYFYSFA